MPWYVKSTFLMDKCKGKRRFSYTKAVILQSISQRFRTPRHLFCRALFLVIFGHFGSRTGAQAGSTSTIRVYGACAMWFLVLRHLYCNGIVYDSTVYDPHPIWSALYDPPCTIRPVRFIVRLNVPYTVASYTVNRIRYTVYAHSYTVRIRFSRIRFRLYGVRLYGGNVYGFRIRFFKTLQIWKYMAFSYRICLCFCSFCWW